jgi:hypothetical protein
MSQKSWKLRVAVSWWWANQERRNYEKLLEEVHPGTAASLREGMEETLTVIRLGLPELLQTTLRSTNAIESAFKTVREVSRNERVFHRS